MFLRKDWRNDPAFPDRLADVVTRVGADEIWERRLQTILSGHEPPTTGRMRSTLTAERDRPLSALWRFCTLVKQKYRGRITSVKKVTTTPAVAQGHAIDEADRRGRPSDMILRPIRVA